MKNQLPPTGRAAKLSRPKTPSPATHRPSEEQSSQAGTQRFLVKNNFAQKVKKQDSYNKKENYQNSTEKYVYYSAAFVLKKR